MTILFKYLTLLISSIILGKAEPFNSEKSEGNIRVMGLNFENFISSFSSSSSVLSEKLCRVATNPF